MRQNRAIVASPTKLRVLVVEDNSDTRIIYEETLHGAGYVVTTAASLAEAEELALAQKPDLAIVDCGLPDGNGIDLLRRWKATAAMADVPIVMATAQSGSEYIRDASSAGADAFLVKPCWDDLTAFLARLVQDARTSRCSSPSQSTIKRKRYRVSSTPPLALVPSLAFEQHAGELVARCHRCLQTSPALGDSEIDASDRATLLGWSSSFSEWTCPTCVEHSKRSE